MDHYIVYSKRLANRLVMDGFRLISTEINIKHPEFLVFIFERSDALLEAIRKYKNS